MKKIAAFAGLALFAVLAAAGFLLTERGRTALERLYYGRPFVIYPDRIDLGDCEAGAEMTATFYLKNFSGREISIIAEKSTCPCLFSVNLPLTAEPGKTAELKVCARLSKYAPDYDHALLLTVAERGEALAICPVRVTASVPEPLEPTQEEIDAITENLKKPSPKGDGGPAADSSGP